MRALGRSLVQCALTDMGSAKIAATTLLLTCRSPNSDTNAAVPGCRAISRPGYAALVKSDAPYETLH